ncbi:MAG: hypothetical protein HY744_09720, partial [Deltaproteobacteria bacterium]|nr:hypothetical protein [Deltaproteobacteria bacterium]
MSADLDERRRYPGTWLLVSALLAATAGWAVYHELVTRAPWRQEQRAFFALDLDLAQRARALAEQRFAEQDRPALAPLLARREALRQARRAPGYEQARQRLARLDAAHDAAERDKTLAASRLEQARYERALAEYARDEAREALRRALARGPAPGSGAGAADPRDEILTAPAPPPPAAAGASAAGPTPELGGLLGRLGRAAARVVAALRIELRLQERVDRAVARLAAIDGPDEPALTAGDPAGQERERRDKRALACAGRHETRTCLRWLELDPVDVELGRIDAALARAERPVDEARKRVEQARRRAEPGFDWTDLVRSIVGPYEIRQIATSWMAPAREVDLQQVDRCPSCHLGVDSSQYEASSIPRAFRTHPERRLLLGAHPVERFGCTCCHQGQGRATNDWAHSGLRLTERAGRERWTRRGDPYWEDPLLPVGRLSGVVVGEDNDALLASIDGSSWQGGQIGLRRRADVSEPELWGEIEAGLQALVRDRALGDRWRAVARKLGGRVTIGLEPIEPEGPPAQGAAPRLSLRFPKPGLA